MASVTDSDAPCCTKYSLSEVTVQLAAAPLSITMWSVDRKVHEGGQASSGGSADLIIHYETLPLNGIQAPSR
jgi:hypothetical protein